MSLVSPTPREYPVLSVRSPTPRFSARRSPSNLGRFGSIQADFGPIHLNVRGRGLGAPWELLWEVTGQRSEVRGQMSARHLPCPLYYYSFLGAPSHSPHVRVASKAVHPEGKIQKHTCHPVRM